MRLDKALWEWKSALQKSSTRGVKLEERRLLHSHRKTCIFSLCATKGVETAHKKSITVKEQKVRKMQASHYPVKLSYQN